MENPIIAAGERQNNRIPIRYPRIVMNPCECGVGEAVAVYKGKQKLCITCLEGILEVELI
ncbi:hypothetical protein L1N85_10895 [Paenibacillus alkaliterrae]|uniref:hypothetical protein n=1 Tax=Paenibacillus alkaliterrae TaxID=320909 RepID=UPI001F2467A3|nr:hypothetical protein [Paenibacillus alkaliterrae]MCF2938943.1 hypothetical protein [Paenibacillus alkaliterrae]